MTNTNKLVIGAIAVVIVAAGIMALAKPTQTNEPDNSGSNITEQQPAEPNTVVIKDFDFQTEKLVVKKGTTVTWINQDDAHHDITPTSGTSDFAASKLLAKGEKYQFTFNEAGSYSYKCSPHPYMTAEIEVTE